MCILFRRVKKDGRSNTKQETTVKSPSAPLLPRLGSQGAARPESQSQEPPADAGDAAKSTTGGKEKAADGQPAKSTTPAKKQPADAKKPDAKADAKKPDAKADAKKPAGAKKPAPGKAK